VGRRPGKNFLALLTALFMGGGARGCDMKGKFDTVTIIHVVFVGAYLAIALDHVAQYDPGYSLQEIRGAAMTTAVVLAATFIAIDFFGKKLGKAK
jgi:hypothetical protein